MVTVRLYGTLRLDSGLKELCVDADSVAALQALVYGQIQSLCPEAGITAKQIKGCMAVRNGKMLKPDAKLSDGDELMLVPASGGG